MGALDNLMGAINQFAGVAENSPSSLNSSVVPGADIGGLTVNFGALGEFAGKIDQTAHRSYVEDGFIRRLRPRQSEILMQEPDLTVVIKKRMFSSLVENYKPELMDAKEKLFYRASKKLFQNKCSAISAYENLTKIDRIIKNTGTMNNYMFPVVMNALDILSGAGLSLVDAKTMATMETLMKVQNLSEPTYRTTWILERELPAVSDLGDGTGVFEITNISSITTTSSVEFGGGSASFTIEDPYRLMIVTQEDIERAIKETYAGFLNNAFFRVTEVQLEKTVQDLRNQLDSARRARGASAIRFFVNENSLLFKKLRAVIDEEGREIRFEYDGGLAGLGSSVDVDSSALEGTNGLSSSDTTIPVDGFNNVRTTVNELDVFKQLVSNMYLLMGMKKSTETNNFQFNKDTNYVRRKMKLHYGGKTIIQPKDVVHVYKSTKSLIDAKTAAVVNDSLLGMEIASAINDTIAAIDDLEKSFNGESGDQSFAVVEKNAIAGPDFPMWLWNMMRNDFTRQAAGCHTWAGLVANADPSMSGGKFTVTVNAKDNCSYFEQGQININPSVEVHNSRLYDPLTPFDLDFDLSSGFLNGEDGQAELLQENKVLLNSGIIKFKNGRFRGYPANEQIYNSFDVEKIQGSTNAFSVRRKYEDPDGLVYRWKEGIQSHTLLGEPHPSGQLPQDTAPSLTKDPFAGQDVMNVLALLVTGLPYNFNTFMRAAISAGGFSRDDLLNENTSSSFLRGLLSDITKNNATWGAFIPFKKMIINDEAYRFLRSGEIDLVTANRKLQEKLRERAARFDQLVTIAPAFGNNPQYLNVNSSGQIVNSLSLVDGVLEGLGGRNIQDTTGITKLTSDILSLDFEIEQLKTQFQKGVNDTMEQPGALRIAGNDISFDPEADDGSTSIPDDVERARQDMRKKLNYLTQRRLWKVKANEDTNFFIVDDSYDKNYDIQAFEQALAGSLELFKSNYMTIGEKIRTVASLLGLEVFADTQGHIQARPPQYNRMPSSVFYKMIETKDLTGVQIFPPYLESLFVNQVKGLSEKIEVLEDEIRLRAAVLGYTSDSDSKKLLAGFVPGGGTSIFGFVTDETSGKFGGVDIRTMFNQLNPDELGESATNALKAIGTQINSLRGVINKSRNFVSFDIVQRVNIVAQTKFVTNASPTDLDDRVNRLRERIASRTGRPAPEIEIGVNQEGARSQVDTLAVTEQLAQLLGQRQSALKLLSNALKNLEEGIAVNASKDAGRSLLLPFLNKKKLFPEILAHMIEDEDYDDIGPGSGKRYVIKDHQIISMNLSEREPEYTAVEVNGLFDPFLGNQDIGFDAGGGNPLSTAWAVDYDLWRMYGFKAAPPVTAPMLSNPDTQCAPFAVYLLNKARGNIFQGTIEIAGNEYMQPGEVYYIESLDLLFYAEKVTHNFNYGGGGGGSFTTTLQLSYGHNPGEYIPTILDIIGKGLYTSKHQADLARHNRHGNSTGDIHISTVVYDNTMGFEPLQALVSGSYANANRKAMSNALLAASGALNPSTSGRRAKLELRWYSDSDNSLRTADLNDVAEEIKTWIRNPTKLNISTDGELVPDNAPQIPVQISDTVIQVVEIDVSDNDPRSPSAGAINKARELAATSGIPTATEEATANTQNIELLEFMLTSRVIDIWLVFDSVPVTNEINSTTEDDKSQAAQLAFQQALADFNAKVQSQQG